MDVPLLSSVSVLALVGYTGVVILHGNLVAMLHQIYGDRGYLYWMVAVGILYYLSKQPTIGAPITFLVGMGILGVLLKVFGGQANFLPQVFQDFAAGKINIVQAFEVFATTAGTRLGLYQGSNLSAYSTPGASR